MTDLQSRIAALSPEKRVLLEQRVAEMAAARGPEAQDHVKPRDRSQPTPLAIPQEREWTISRFRGVNNIPGAFRVAGAVDLSLISRVFTEITSRHEVLRSTVEIRDDGTLEQVTHPVAEVPVPVTDLAHLTAGQQLDEVRRRWEAEVATPFSPEQPQRLRISMLRMAPDNHVALITTDHAAADLVSVALLVEEFATLYAVHLADGPGIEPVAVQYGDFAAWQRGLGHERMAAEQEFWRKALDGVRGRLVLPADRPYPARPTFAGAEHVVDLSPELTASLRRFGETEKASTGVLLLAAVAVLLSRYLDQSDLIIGEFVSGRNRPETQWLIGCFNTALPLRIQLAEEQTLREVVQSVQQVVLPAYDNQDLSVERLVGELALGRDASLTSLTDMWLNLRTPDRTLEIPGLRVSREPIDITLTAAPLTLDTDPDAPALRLQWIYMTEMFDADTVRLFARQYTAILRQLVAAADTPVWRLELADGRVPSTASGPSGSGELDDREPGFVELFQRRVAFAPYAPAVFYDGVATSYGELDREATRLARRLRALGVGPESSVGILVDRSPRLASAILAVLKAGGAYLPMDPSYPAERIGYMLSDAGARVLITEQRLAGMLAAAQVAVPGQLVVLDDPAAPAVAVAEAEAGRDLPLPLPSSLAYVVYTSGSTGRPKGTMIEHRSLVTYARDIVDRLGMGTGDRFLQFASPGFDVLAEELFPTWLAGGAVVIPAEHLISSGVELADLIERDRLTVIELPTAYWHEWVRELDRKGRELPGCLRLVIIGGERVLPERLALWRARGVPLMHVYGLTETTVSSTFFRLDPADPVAQWPNFPIGTPLPSADLRILDRRLQPVPAGAIGELYIGGVSVARGYFGRRGLTAHRFIADPSPAQPGRRLYRTGDLVRQRPDGNLEFISRVDTQIKIRGFRVEPTEIESTLGQHPLIADSAVTLHEPAPGDRRLVAYVVPRPQATLNAGDLRQYLERELPPYMVPSAFIELAELPLNHNGKVDRDRLPAPDGGRLDSGSEYVAPRTEAQRKLTEIIARVVGVDRVGINDNFFEIGGDSILAIQIVVRAREAGLRLSPYDLFTNPTAAALAEMVVVGPVIDAEQGDVSGPVPVTPTQRWFGLADIAEPHHWNVGTLAELPAPGDLELLTRAVEHLLIHHDGLRQRILLAGDKTRVRIAPRGDAAHVEAHDLAQLDEAAQDDEIARIAAGLQSGLNLAVGPLIRVALFRLGGRRPDRVALIVHHLAADVPSLRILIEDLLTALRQLTDGQPVTLPAKTTSWQSWGRRLRTHATEDVVQRERAYWSRLADADVPALPLDFTTPTATTVSTERIVATTLDAAQAGELLHTVPEALNCQVEELLLAALARALTRWSGAARHVVDLERHARPRLFEDVDLSRTVGWLSYPHPVLLTVEPGDHTDATLRMAKEVIRAVPADGLGWQLLHLGPDPLPDTAAEVSFSYLGASSRPRSCRTSLTDPLGPERGPNGRRPYPVEVHATVTDGELEIRWRYSEATHKRETVEYLADCYLGELRALNELGRSGEGAVLSPSDFPLARVSQPRLDDLLARLSDGGRP